jgi:ribose transport system permease protein
MSVPTPPDPRTPQSADAAPEQHPQHVTPPPAWPPTSAPPQTPSPQPTGGYQGPYYGPPAGQTPAQYGQPTDATTRLTPEPPPGQAQPGQFQPGQYQPGQFQPGQAQPGQAQAGHYQPGQYQPGQFQPGQVPPGQPPSGQAPPGSGWPAQVPPTSVPVPSPARPGLVRSLAPNLLWEAVLLLAAVIVIIVVHTSYQGGRGGFALWGQLAIIGLLAAGFALSLRTGTPNLAIAAIASLCGYWYVEMVVEGDMSKVVAGLLAVLAATGIGLVMALIVGLTGLPAWAVSLVGLFLLQGILYTKTSGGETIPLGGSSGKSFFVIFSIVFLVGSIAGGVAMALPAVRAALSRNRAPAPGETATGWSMGRLLGAGVGMIGSSALAGLAGVIIANRLAASSGVDNGLLLEALVAALLGGVSLFGGRAGVFGVALAVLLIVHVEYILAMEGTTYGVRLIVIASAGVFALLVNWLIEFLGRMMTPKVTTP